MSQPVIQVEELSKAYRLGAISSGSLRQDVQWWLRKTFKKTDPFFQEEERGRSMIWALKDVSFSIGQGEAWGIVGSNGSGKSTLLKIISRIVEPTRGLVRGRGKVSSILEVGTGFHWELTGRDNIFISGYTLGMSKSEVKRKFDEIVAFAGIEKFIDTPVKRYSSGMYVRLAFAVAAHLEPDILIVDEVLAVGDADFQKKCLGKMHEVSNEGGRTIIFVSHNMQAVANLCTHGLWLDRGEVKKIGKPADIISAYITDVKKESAASWSGPEAAPGNEFIRLRSAQARHGEGPDTYISVRTQVVLDFEFWCLQDNFDLNVNVRLLTITGECVFDSGSPFAKAVKGLMVLQSIIPAHLLNNTSYVVSLTFVKNGAQHICTLQHCIAFDVEDNREGMTYFGTWPGIIRPPINSVLYHKEG